MEKVRHREGPMGNIYAMSGVWISPSHLHYEVHNFESYNTMGIEEC